MERLLLRPTEAADAIGIGRSKVYELLKHRQMPSVQVGGRLRVPADRLRQWVEQKIQEQTNAR